MLLETIPALLARRAMEEPDRPFLDDGSTHLTYGGLAGRVRELATELRDCGVVAGDRVCLLIGNDAPGIVAWLAVTTLGAMQVPLNTRNPPEALGRLVADARPSVVIADGRVALPDRLPAGVGAVIPLGAEPLPSSWPRATGRMPTSAPMTSAAELTTSVVASDPAAILYTSGTTGGTKGAVCSHGFLTSFAATIADQFELGPRDRIYNCLPQFHSSGQIAGVLLALIAGCSLVTDARFSRRRFWRRIVETEATFALAIGGMLSLLETLPVSRDERAHRLRVIYASPAPREQAIRLEARFGVPIRQNYGSTEQGIVAVQRLQGAVPGSMGRTVDHVELVIADEADRPCPPGEVGQILTRPKEPWTMFSGYWQRPDLTAAVSRNLWFHSGDLAWSDRDGNLFYVDRAGDVIRRRGENIAAAELEAAVVGHPAVSEAAAVGVPSPLGEQDVLLTVVAQPGAMVDPEDLVAFCERTVADFMVPRYVQVVAELPKTASEKVQRAVLRERGVGPGTWDRDADRATVAARHAQPAGGPKSG